MQKFNHPLHSRTGLRVSCVMLLMAASIGVGAQAQDPDAVYRLLRRTYSQAADGSIDVRVRKELTLYRNRAITAYADKGETFIVYNPASEQVTINESYTVRADGKHVLTPSNAVLHQLPAGCADCGRYNHLRELAIIHTALEPKATIVLDYTLHHQGEELLDVFDLQQDCPVERYELVIGKGFEFATKHPNLKPDADGRVLLTNIEQRPADAYRPESSYRCAVRRGGNVPMPSCHQPVLLAQPLLAELFENSAEAYLVKIYNYVMDVVHTQTIEPTRLNFQVSTADATLSSGCGTAQDKAVLLATLINQAGTLLHGEQAKENLSAYVEQIDRDDLFASQVPTVTATDGAGHTYVCRLDKKELLRTDEAPHIETIVGAKDPYYTEVKSGTSWKKVKKIGDQHAELADGYSHWHLNRLDLALVGLDMKQLASDRKTPLYIASRRELTDTISCSVEDNGHLVGAPVSLNRQESGVGSAYLSIREEGGHINVMARLVVEPGTYKGKDYQRLRSMLAEWVGQLDIYTKRK